MNLILRGSKEFIKYLFYFKGVGWNIVIENIKCIYNGIKINAVYKHITES